MVAGFSHLWGAELLKVAILIDGSFFSKKFYHRNKKHPNPNDVKKLIDTWSGREDLNLRPLEPHSSALPDCATPRRESRPLASSSTGVKEAKGKNDPPEPSGAFAAPGPEKG
jgi:hypothetical protein